MKKFLGIFFVVVSFFSASTLHAQQNLVDSLENVLHHAKTDSAKVDALIALADQYRRGDPEKCWVTLQEAKLISEKINYRKGVAYALDEMANYKRRENDHETADQLLKDALKIFTQLNYPPGIGLCYLDLAINSSARNRRDEASEYFSLGEKAYRSGMESRIPHIRKEATQGLITIFHYHFSDFYYHGEYEKGVEFLLKNEDEVRRILPELLPNFYNDLGAAYSDWGKFDKAIEAHRKGLAGAEKLKDYDSQQYCLNNIASVYYNQSDFAAAYEYAEKALNIQLTYRAFDKRNIANSYQNLGEIALARGNYNLALKNYLNALRILENLHDNQEGKLRLSLSNLYFLQHDLKNAEEQAEKALTLLQLKQNNAEIADALVQLGHIAAARNRVDSALHLHLKALALRKEVGNDQNISASLFEIGKIYSDLANTEIRQRNANNDSAVFYYKQALVLSKKISNEQTQVSCYTGLGKVEEGRGNLSEAASYYQLAAHVADSIGIKRELYEAYLYLAEVSEKLNRFDDAYRFHKLYSQVKDSVFNETSSKQIKDMQAKYEAEKKDEQLALMTKDLELRASQVGKQKLLKFGFLILAILIIAFAAVFINRLQLRKKLEKQEAVLQERRRISTDMHDDLGSGLSKIALLTQVMKQHTHDAGSKEELDKISESAQESLEKMSEIVWSLNPKNDKLENLISYIRKFAVEYFEPTNITCKVNMPAEIPETEMKGEQRRNIFLSVKEALHNVQKHSGATAVELSFLKNENHGEIVIHDNGKGIVEDEMNRFGNGLHNMKQRMQFSGGYFAIENKEGTTIRLGYQIT